ncbi:hypothetical protein ACOYR1_13140 [Thalassotalea piscium]
MADKSTCEFVESANFGEMTAKVIACDQETFKSTSWFDVLLANAFVFSSLVDICLYLESRYNGKFKAMVVGEDASSKESLIESMNIIHKQLVIFH